MSVQNETSSRRAIRPPIAILGIPFDNVTRAEAVELVEGMIASRQPHYLVTPNVDFLVQARKDVELRRILFEAHLVLCDGTPLVWASKLLGNPLPERVAGADLVPLLIQIAARKNYRLFLLGATPESAQSAVTRLQREHSGLAIAGHYSPPFNRLLEMDHEEINRRIRQAEPDLLFVSFGCPKQEKWVAMHYRHLGVPVTVGVGATIDFLAGQVKRAPLWMQRSGTEWIFRLAQEPRRLFSRYATDLWGFSSSIVPQWWKLQARPHSPERYPRKFRALNRSALIRTEQWFHTRLPERFDFAEAVDRASLAQTIIERGLDCVVETRWTAFIDSTGIGWLIRLHKKLAQRGRKLILLSPSPAVRHALGLMRVTDFFRIARNRASVYRILGEHSTERHRGYRRNRLNSFRWPREVTAANADTVWQSTQGYLTGTAGDHVKVINLSSVRFIDSTGLGLMVRAKKRCAQSRQALSFIGVRPPVRNVLRLSQLEDFLLSSSATRCGRPFFQQV